MKSTIGQIFLNELQAEETATRKCLERVPANLFNYKPHEKSMLMGYMALHIADVPKWIVAAIHDGEIDFATWEKYNATTTEDVLKRFDENMAAAKDVLKNVSDEELEGTFVLKAGDHEILRSVKRDSISSFLNHWVHHRGQLTVYLRLNDIAVPSIYGPSADEKTF